MRDGLLLGVERRRRWTDEAKLAILGEVGVDGRTVADVARRHDLTRQHIYQWRGELRRKGLWPVAEAKANGFVQTLFGRRIHTPEIAERGPRAGMTARAAINAPIQGSAADVIRRAMVRVPGALRAEGLSAGMLLQVHDELLFETPEAEAVIAVARKVMEAAAAPVVALSVPLVLDAGRGGVGRRRIRALHLKFFPTPALRINIRIC